LVTLAPELPGALDLVISLTERGVVLGAGHSNSTFAEAKAGFDAGIRYGTHLFNAMPPLHHREPGLVAALLTDSRITVGLVTDGVHIHAAMIGLTWCIVGSSRLTLVSDAMAALGMSPGEYLLGGSDVVVDESSARLADGTLAGSILSLDAALRNLMAFAGCSLQDALPTVTSTPAALLAILDQRGQLAPGLVADLVLLTPDLNVAMTVVSGEVVYARGN
jgi:N-acetylglucosamine-6-phosphate deacetylase